MTPREIADAVLDAVVAAYEQDPVDDWECVAAAAMHALDFCPTNDQWEDVTTLTCAFARMCCARAA